MTLLPGARQALWPGKIRTSLSLGDSWVYSLRKGYEGASPRCIHAFAQSVHVGGLAQGARGAPDKQYQRTPWVSLPSSLGLQPQCPVNLARTPAGHTDPLTLLCFAL